MDHIEKLRHDLRLFRATDLSRLCRLNEQTIWKIQNGKNKPRWDSYLILRNLADRIAQDILSPSNKGQSYE